MDHLRYVLFLFCLLAPYPALAQTLIRDTETEYLIERYTQPLLEAARLRPDAISVQILNDPRPNAFVGRAHIIWLHTGMIRRARSPEALIGVIAHELGHITGRHVPEMDETRKMSRVGAAVLTLIGIGLLAAGEDNTTETGVGLITAIPPMAMGLLHSHSRSQEREADAAAIAYMRRAGFPPEGLLEALEIFHQDEIFASKAGRYLPPQYLLTHPYSRERTQFIRRNIEENPFDQVTSPELKQAHKMVQTKLQAFLDDPSEVLEIYADRSDLPGRYARSIALHRLAYTQEALQEIDVLIDMQETNPFFHELKGQILLENLQPIASIPHYKKAVSLAPQLLLLRMELARALVATDSPSFIKEAIPHLKRLTQDPKIRPLAFHTLARAVGTLGQQGLGELYTAQYYASLGNKIQATVHACRAQQHLQKGSPAWQQAQDISPCKAEKKPPR